MLGLKTIDDNAKFVHNFIKSHGTREHVEFEGRIGRHLLGDDRLCKVYGIRTFCCFDASVLGSHFDASLEEKAFVVLNKALNQYFYNVNHSSGVSAEYAQYKGIQPLSYAHTVDLDLFYRDGVRYSIPWDDKRRGERGKAILKVHIGHLDIMVPSSSYDLRISCKKEEPVPEPSGDCEFIRKKDRISYTFNYWSVDLTKVETFEKRSIKGNRPIGPADHITYELELELAHMKVIQKELEHSEFIFQLAEEWLKSLKQMCFIAGNNVPKSCLPSTSKKRQRES